MNNATHNQHYATLLGLGAEWNVTNVELDTSGKRIDIFVFEGPAAPP